MKKIMLTAMVLGSAVTLAACADNGYNSDADLTGAPYAEDRTVGADNNVVRRPVVRSAEPVFEETQMK